MECPTCGRSVEEVATRCPACGSNLDGGPPKETSEPKEGMAEVKTTFTHCYRCEAVLEETNARRCPQCGRYQYRVCYCGQEIYKGWRQCPHCGADWSHKHVTKEKHRRRRRGSRRRFRFSQLYVYILSGIIIGASLFPLFAWGVQRLLDRLHPKPTTTHVGTTGRAKATPAPIHRRQPEDILTRFQRGLVDFLTGVGRRGLRVARSIWTVIRNHPAFFGGALVGGLGGAVLYLHESGRLRVPFLPRRPRRHRRKKKGGYYD